MKVHYTPNFKEDLATSYKNLSLSGYKLISSENLNENNLIKVTSIPELDQKETLLTSYSDPSMSNEYYKLEGVYYKNTGVQLFLDIPLNKSSLYSGRYNDFYQGILVYYSDLTSNTPEKKKLAFILYGKFENSRFSDLNLTSNNLEIIIPTLPNYNCSITIDKSEIVEYMESFIPDNTAENKFILRDYYEQKIMPEKFIADESTLGYRNPIQYINQYGIKIY